MWLQRGRQQQALAEGQEGGGEEGEEKEGTLGGGFRGPTERSQEAVGLRGF